jgi:hypothetical protein
MAQAHKKRFIIGTFIKNYRKFSNISIFLETFWHNYS